MNVALVKRKPKAKVTSKEELHQLYLQHAAEALEVMVEMMRDTDHFRERFGSAKHILDKANEIEESGDKGNKLVALLRAVDEPKD